MSTLQLSLAIAGVLLLIAVGLHSVWSSRKQQPKRPTPGTPSAVGKEPSAGSQEPVLQDERQEPAFDSELAELQSMTLLEKKPGLDPLIDVIAPIAVESPVSGEAALSAMPGTRRAGSKPFAVEGLRADTGEWELPAPGQRYSAFQAGVQLANRTGALNQIEFSEFVIKAQAFADAVGGEPEFPDMLEEVNRARELDHFASAHDAQLGFTVRAARTAWSPGYVQQSAARQGFVPGAMPGRMVLPAVQAGRAPILGLSFDTQAAMADEPEQTALREFSLSLDVPQVARSEQPFARMCEAAIALAASMDGIIIDDDGNPIRAEGMESIHADLEGLYDTLDGRDLSAGSVAGRRLFS